MTIASNPAPAGSRYFAVGARFVPERSRLRLLEGRSDAVTFDRLRAVGVSSGWRCLEVGAGAGSVARWLGAQVGPAGHVTAADIDTRFLGHLRPPVEVRRQDIVSNAVETGAYDLVHCRSVLMHLEDPGAALARMAGALRPDGWLVIENNDYSSFAAVSSDNGRATRWDLAAASVLSLARRHSVFVADLGRRLPGLIARTGLHIVATDGRTTVRHGRDPVARFLSQSLRTLSGLAEFSEAQEDISILLADLDDPSFEFVDATNFGVSAVNLGSARCP